MNEILGHDVNGRPLRAGDRVLVVDDPRVQRPYIGACGVAIGMFDQDTIRVRGIRDLEYNDDWIALHSWALRRIDDRTDHQPSEYTYDQLLGRLKRGEGVPV